MMLYSTYNLIVSGALLLLISFIATIDPATWVIIASSISCCSVTFSLCILFLPKVYIEYNEVTIVASEIFNNATFHKYNTYNRGLSSKHLSLLSGRSEKIQPSCQCRRNSSSRDLVSFVSITKPTPLGSYRTSKDMESPCSIPRFCASSFEEENNRNEEKDSVCDKR